MVKDDNLNGGIKKHNSLKKGKTYEELYGTERAKEIKEGFSRIRKGKVSPNKGKKMSEESKLKMSKAKKGKPSSRKGTKHKPESIEKMSIANKGKHLSQNTEFKKGQMRGERVYGWKGGITPLTKKIRHCYKYIKWKSQVFERDNWTCQTCGKRGCTLEVHHIKSFSQIFKENNIKTFEDAIKCSKFWDVSNGVTLCKDCHNLTKNNKERIYD